jgi:hypothetical protein
MVALPPLWPRRARPSPARGSLGLQLLSQGPKLLLFGGNLILVRAMTLPQGRRPGPLLRHLPAQPGYDREDGIDTGRLFDIDQLIN